MLEACYTPPTSLIPAPPEPTRHDLKVIAQPTATTGTWYLYRGIRIFGAPKDTMHTFHLPGLPMGKDGSVGGIEDVRHCVAIIDRWLDHQRLVPPYVTPGTWLGVILLEEAGRQG